MEQPCYAHTIAAGARLFVNGALPVVGRYRPGGLVADAHGRLQRPARGRTIVIA